MVNESDKMRYWILYDICDYSDMYSGGCQFHYKVCKTEEEVEKFINSDPFLNVADKTKFYKLISIVKGESVEWKRLEVPRKEFELI